MLKIQKNFKLILVFLWILLVASLAVWWMIFSLQLLDQVAQHSNQWGAEIIAHRKMLMFEGMFWIFLLLTGGGALIYFVFQERKRADRIHEFFAAFSHDVKTSLASLRLQSECLKEDLQGERGEPLVDRILTDTVRLQFQLENSLFLANEKRKNLYLENFSLREVVRSISLYWPEVKIQIDPDAMVRGDRRVLEAVFTNLIQNSVTHGSASQIQMEVKGKGDKNINILLEDNGLGFQGTLEEIGTIFYRHNSKSGSGVGLYIVKELMRQMGGKVFFSVDSDQKNKLKICLELEGHQI